MTASREYEATSASQSRARQLRSKSSCARVTALANAGAGAVPLSSSKRAPASSVRSASNHSMRCRRPSLPKRQSWMNARSKAPPPLRSLPRFVGAPAVSGSRARTSSQRVWIDDELDRGAFSSSRRAGAEPGLRQVSISSTSGRGHRRAVRYRQSQQRHCRAPWRRRWRSGPSASCSRGAQSLAMASPSRSRAKELRCSADRAHRPRRRRPSRVRRAHRLVVKPGSRRKRCCLGKWRACRRESRAEPARRSGSRREATPRTR